jgi:DNA-binding NarL/FixJ family response regulator
MRQIKVILAEPSFLLRKGMIELISELEEFSIVKEIENKSLLSDGIENANPDLIIINPVIFEKEDCQVPLSYIPAGFRKKIIGLTNNGANCSAFQFIETINTNDSKSIIIQKLRNCASSVPIDNRNRQESEISEREKLVVKFVALGLTNKEIADKLYISAHTVITHRKNITRKLGIKTVSGLTIYAIMNNLIALEEIK